ncbi:4453_t:CDS:2 [Dentiscutata erythropus]|uniref:4453_t:CDS:1 n=1 Tax=Dentiscutata erythropus TaxID=1348616 RepID=A0A9N9DN99_9GLOM|nr:4453_t:CDS:2 [Dentiscutata erythropus]
MVSSFARGFVFRQKAFDFYPGLLIRHSPVLSFVFRLHEKKISTDIHGPRQIDDGFLPKKLKKKKKVPPPPPPIINIPGFVRISGARHNMVVYFEELRRDKSRRKRQGSLVVHGAKYIKDLIAKGHRIKSIGITAPEDLKSVNDIAGSSKEVFQNINQFPADRYYVTSVEWTRKILGGEARVDNREIWAELPFPNISFPKNISRLLVLDHVIDGVNMGMLIRAADALRWDASFIIAGTVDLFDEQVIRTSRCTSVTWPSKTGFWHDLYALTKEHDLTLVIADAMPHNRSIQSQNNICFWNPTTQEIYDEIPSSRIALVLGSKMHGVTYRDAGEDIIRVSIPMLNNVNSLNVAMAGNILINAL